jgi:penicillin amidase
MKSFRIFVLVLLCCAVSACSALRQLPTTSSLDQRLAAFPTENLPLKGKTTIYWDEHQIPFIEAEYDADAAFALGLVHAHLRLGFLELGRRISQGRMSEIVGKASLDVDHAILALDFGRAIPEIMANMDPQTREWMEAFVAGINHYISTTQKLPQEFRVLKLTPEPWTIEDLLLISRLAGSDANWKVWLTLLKFRERDDWPEIWAQLLDVGGAAQTTYDGMELDDFDEVVGGFRFSGSNAMAIGPSRTKSGTTLFAADPHVGYIAPNLWMIAGLKSPSYHIIGIMPTGFPFFALGRSPTTAWGGTNLYAASSSFYDVSDLPADEITTRTVQIQVKSDVVDVDIRETKYGPIISDLAMFDEKDIPDVSLRWVGHRPSYETNSMLAANRATSFEQFRAAFGGYAVSGMNMLYADKDGNIGQVQAATVPRRTNATPRDIIRKPEEINKDWESFVDATELAVFNNPAIGYVASSNNKPPPGKVPVGLFFSTNDRINRFNSLMQEKGTIDLDDLKAIQQDVYMEGSVKVRDAFMEKINSLNIADQLGRKGLGVLDAMENWDGHFTSQSRGALAYELVRSGYAKSFYKTIFGDIDGSGLTRVVGSEFRLLLDLENGDSTAIANSLVIGLQEAAPQFNKLQTWGAAHRLELVHPFAAIPLVGNRYRFGDQPIGGSSQTLAKSSFSPAGEGFTPRAGATARFVADLSDPNENYFVLISGQDGWFNSSTFLDQMPVFLAGDYIQLPLMVEQVRANAYHIDELVR